MEPFSYDASPLTTAVVLFSITAPVWYTWLTFRKTRYKAALLASICLVWGAFMFGVTRYGWLSGFPGGRAVLALVTLFIPTLTVILLLLATLTIAVKFGFRSLGM